MGFSVGEFEGGFEEFNSGRVEVDLFDGGEGLSEGVVRGEGEVVDCSGSLVSDACRGSFDRVLVIPVVEFSGCLEAFLERGPLDRINLLESRRFRVLSAD